MVFSQNKTKVICDFQTKKIIPYSSIQFLGSKKGIYSNERGEFLLTRVKCDSIIVSCIGYRATRLKVKGIKDTIFLKQNFEILEEVKLITGKSKDRKIGYIKKKKNLSWHIKKKTELATLIRYNKYYKDAYIKKIFIPISKEGVIKKGGIWKSYFPNFRSVFRVHLYSNSDGKPNESILKKPILIECDQNSNDIIEIDINDEFIKFPKEGVFVGVEMIGELSTDKNILNKSKSSLLPSFKFTEKKKKNVTSFSFIKNVFSDNMWVDIDKNNRFSQITGFNMAVSLTLSVYK